MFRYIENLRKFIRLRFWWFFSKPCTDQSVHNIVVRVAERINVKPFKYVKVAEAPFYNAVVAGFLCRSLVVTKSLLQASPDIIEAVILHEYAHCKLRHQLKLLSAALLLQMLALVLSIVIVYMNNLHAFYAIVFYFAAYPAIQVILKYIARKFEIEADIFAVTHSSSRCSYIRLLCSLKQYSSHEHRLLSLLFGSHPSIETRIKSILMHYPEESRCIEGGYCGGPGGI